MISQEQGLFAQLNPIKCGCYILNPEIIAHYGNKLVLAPLHSINYHIYIVNSLVKVALNQTYFNPTKHFLELEYSFPIHPKACLFKFVAIFGNSRIEGTVREKNEAKNEYKEAVKSGRKAAYGEIDDKNREIMTVAIGNVPPQSEVRIELEYLQELTLSLNTFYQMQLLGNMSPRYLNSLSPQKFRTGSKSVQGGKGFQWSFQISLRTTRKIVFFKSHSHQLFLVSQNESSKEINLEMEKSCRPNQNFIFAYTTEDYQLPSQVFGRNDCSSTVMISLIPKFCSLNLDDAFSAALEGKVCQTNIEYAKGQYVFMLDRSGSMGGKRIERAKQALSLFLRSLPIDCFFNVVSFGNKREKMFDKSVDYCNLNLTKAQTQIQKMAANMGGTYIYRPLQQILKAPTIIGYPKQIFLLTDGEVGDTEQIKEMIALNTNHSRVHTIGIGNGASEALIIGCAERGKGCHIFIKDSDNLSQKIIQLLSDSLSPLITSLSLKYDQSLVESVIPNPKNMPFVLKGDLVNLYVTYKGQLEKKTSFAFEYVDSMNQLPYKCQIEVDPQSQNEFFVDKMSHFKKINILEQALQSKVKIEDLMYYVKSLDLKAQIINESIKYQILNPLTAFISVEKELIDGIYQQMKEKRSLKILIPNEQLRLSENYYLSSQKRSRRYSKSSSPKRRDGRSKRNISRSKSRCQRLKQNEKFKRSERVKFNREMLKKSNRRQRSYSSSQSQSASSSSSQSKQKKKQKSRHIQGKKDKKEQSNQPENNKQANFDAHTVISHQNSDGSWSDCTIFEKLFGGELLKMVILRKDKIAVLTYLMAQWLQKRNKRGEWRLILNKAFAFVKKQNANLTEYQQLFDQYI